MTTLGTLAVKLRADTAEFVRDLKGAEVGLQGVADTAKKVATVAGIAFGGMALLGAKFVSVASDMDENMNVVATSFGKMTPEILKWARTAADEMGRSEFQMREFAGSTQAMLAPMVGSKEAAARMSTQIAQLAVDIGSFNNVADADALLAIKAGLIGSTEPMMKFGVVMHVAALEAFALSRGITESVKDMGAAEKVALRYAFIMEKTSLQQGDAAKTSQSFANVMKSIEGLLTDIAGQIGAEMIPMVNQFAKGIRDLLKWFKGLSPEVKKFAAQGLMAATALAGIVAGLATAAAILPSIIAGFGTMVTVLAAVAPIVAAIGVAIATAGVLMVGYGEISKTTTDDVRLMWKQLGNDIKDSLNIPTEEIGSFADTVRSAFDDLMNDVKGLWDEGMAYLAGTPLVKFLADIVGFVAESLGQWSWLTDQIGEFFGNAVDDIVKLWDWVANSYFGQIADTIIGVFLSIWGGILTVFITPFKLAFEAIGETIDFWGKKLGIFKTGTEKAIEKAAALGIPEITAGELEGRPGRPALSRKERKEAAKKADETMAARAEIKNFAEEMKATSAKLAPAFEGVVRGLETSSLAIAKVGARELPSALEKSIAAIKSGVDVAGKGLVDALIAGSGTLGDVIEGAKAGMESGGPWGALIGAIAALLQKTEFFRQVIETVNEILGSIVGLLDSILAAFTPLLEMIGEFVTTIVDLLFGAAMLNAAFAVVGGVIELITGVLGLVLKVLGPFLGVLGLIGEKIGVVVTRIFGFQKGVNALGRASEWVGDIMMNIAQAFRRVWNRVIDWFADLAAKVHLGSLARSIRKAKISFSEVEKAAGGVTPTGGRGGGNDPWLNLNKSMGDLGDTVDSLNASLTNVPEGFKVQAARFQAIDVGGPGGMEALGGQQPSGSITFNIQVDDIESAVDRISDELEERGYSKTGSRLGGLAFGVDTGGA
jgi:hypothetical protein